MAIANKQKKNLFKDQKNNICQSMKILKKVGFMSHD